MALRCSRGPHGPVVLTSAGEAFLQRAQRTLRNVQRDIDETRSIGRGEVGSLHIGFVGSGMLTTLPAIFSAYRQQYPGVRLHLHESFTSRVIEGLENGTLDAGILRDGDVVAGVSTAVISTEPFVAVLPVSHRRARQKSIAPATLAEDAFVHYPRSAGAKAYDKPLSLFDDERLGRPVIVQEASHWLSILQLIGAGFGVSIAPTCVRKIAAPEVVCLPLRGTALRSTVELAWRTGETRPIVHQFLKIARGS